MAERESFGSEEISLLLDDLISKNEFLLNVIKDGKDVKKAILHRLQKYRITESEYMMTYEEMTDSLNKTVSVFFEETLLSLLKNDEMQAVMDKNGEIAFAPKKT